MAETGRSLFLPCLRKEVEVLKAFIEQEQVRGAVYQLLSKCYQQPDHFLNTDPKMKQLTDMLPAIEPDTVPTLTEMNRYLEELDHVDALVQEYMVLFVGPKTLLAPPYGSLYLETKGQIMGVTTMEAARYYQAAGVKKTAGLHEPEDHVRVELEFMYYLIARVIECCEAGELSSALQFAQMQRSFLDRHLGCWIRPFALNLEKKAKTPFYQGLARITEAFVRQDALTGSHQMLAELKELEEANLKMANTGDEDELVNGVFAE
jgi:putative dimethyl sulfoxide reductase chaperone